MGGSCSEKGWREAGGARGWTFLLQGVQSSRYEQSSEFLYLRNGDNDASPPSMRVFIAQGDLMGKSTMQMSGMKAAGAGLQQK